MPTTELHMQLWLLASYLPVCGKEEVLDWKPNSRYTVQSSCLACCMPVRLRQSTVSMQSSWNLSTWGASGSFSTSNGRIRFHIWKSFRQEAWWTYILCSRDPSWGGEGTCVIYLMSACQRGCSMISWKQANGPMEVKRNAIKTHWRSPSSAVASFLILGGSCQSSCYLVQPDQQQGDCLWRA